jgi:magnesium-transporting ATPase (P-type)
VLGGTVEKSLKDMSDFEENCLTCNVNDYTHGTIIFNSFIFCQVFNEYTARKIGSEVNILEGLWGNYVFLVVSIAMVGLQIFLVEVGGDFVGTSPLTIYQWLITVALGSIGLIVGVLMRFIPVEDDPNSFSQQVSCEDNAIPAYALVPGSGALKSDEV